MMSDHHRRRSPESSRRRRRLRRDSREQSIVEDAARSTTMPGPEDTNISGASYYPSQAQSHSASSARHQQSFVPEDYAAGHPISMRSNDEAPRAPSASMPVPIPADLNRPRRQPRRRGSGSSSELALSSSASSSSSSSYLDISRWYPSFGRSGGVLKAFFTTPSEHRPRRRRSVRKPLRSKKSKAGIFGFGQNSSSSSVDSDMAYGMGFIKKSKSRGGGFSPNVAGAAAGVASTSSTRRAPPLQRRQTDEEIMEIGRKLADVARKQNREDLRHGSGKHVAQLGLAMGAWEAYQRQSSSAHETSSRGLAPSRHRRNHHGSSSDDGSEWESASEDEDSDEASALAYGHTDLYTPRPTKSSSGRIGTGTDFAGAKSAENTHSERRKSSVVDPQLFGPFNSLRDFVNTPCGFNDSTHAYTHPGTEDQRHVGSAESASYESRPMQRVFPLQTSDPDKMEAARASGSVVSAQPNHTTVPLRSIYSTASAANRPEPVPIQAPKPIAPVPSSMYDENRIRDAEPTERRESRRNPGDSSIFAETALVGAGVAALGAAMLARRDKGKEPEQSHGRHEKYGHDDHREDETKVSDARKAKELALEKEIERLEQALAGTNKAREKRRRESKRVSDPQLDGYHETRQVDAGADEERRRSHTRGSSDPVSKDQPIDVFQFRDPEEEARSAVTVIRAPSPMIIDVTPAPSPQPEERRKSRRDSFEDETRNAQHIYDEATHSTAPIAAVDMAAAIAATERSRRQHEKEWRSRSSSRSGSKTPEDIQEEADRTYRAERVARSRSSGSRDRSVVDKYEDSDDRSPRIVTPPGMSKPQKSKYSEPDADILFDNTMSPTELREYWPKEAPVLDPSAQRPRPVLNLVMPTPVPTPSPEKQDKSATRKSEPAPQSPTDDVANVVLGPKGDVVEVIEAAEVVEPPQTPKSVTWGPSETKQYEVESRDPSLERPTQTSERSNNSGKKSSSGGWGTIAAAITGAGVGAALAREDRTERSGRDDTARDIIDEKRSSDSRSPPKERPILPVGISSQVPEEEPDELPPVPGPKPTSPRHSQMPGAFGEDLDFTATLAAGLEQSGFDPEIVIDDPEYRRRDSPPGSNDPLTAVYMQPFAETATDLGIYDVDYGSGPVRAPGYVIGEVAETPSSEKASLFGQGADDKDRDPPKLSKKEQRKLDKAAKAAKAAQDEQATQPVDAGEDEWAEASSSKKSKKSKKSKRSSVSWDDMETPVGDEPRPEDVEQSENRTATTDADGWDTPKKSKKSKRNSRGSDVKDDDKSESWDTQREPYEPLARDVSSVVSDSRYENGSNGHGFEDDRSIVSAPVEAEDKRSSKSEKRSSGGFWSILKGSSNNEDKNESKKDNAGTLGAGAGLAGAAVAIAALARSHATEATPEQEEPHVTKDLGVSPESVQESPREVDILEDPEVAPRVIKPAIDPQYGDLLPLPPSPGERSSLEFIEDEENLPSLPDSRPATPPGQERALLRDRESSQKRPTHTSHSRRPSTYEAPLRSPSHTAIPIQFRIGQNRSVSATLSRSSPVIGVRSPPTEHNSPASSINEFSPTFQRQPPSRPTSWDSSREFKPLYLLEQTGRSGRDADEDSHYQISESAPLAPSQETSTAENEADGGEGTPLFVNTDIAKSAAVESQEPTPVPAVAEAIARRDEVEPVAEAEPLFIDTNVAQSAPVTSQESTPRLSQNVESALQSRPTTAVEKLHEIPSTGSLLESNYATPFESPSQAPGVSPLVVNDDIEDEKMRSSSPETAADRESIQPQSEESRPEEKLAGRGQKSYFPSPLSILPAVTLAGVGALLGHKKSDESTSSQKETDPSSSSVVPEPLPQLTGDDEARTKSPLKQGEDESTSLEQSADLDEPKLPSSDSQDTIVPEQHSTSPTSRETEAGQTIVGRPDEPDPVEQATPTEEATPAAVDAGDWSLPSSSKKKKNKKGKAKSKGKNSLSDVPVLPAAEKDNVLDSSPTQLETPSRDEPVLEPAAKDEMVIDASALDEPIRDEDLHRDALQDEAMPTESLREAIGLDEPKQDDVGRSEIELDEPKHEASEEQELPPGETAQHEALQDKPNQDDGVQEILGTSLRSEAPETIASTEQPDVVDRDISQDGTLSPTMLAAEPDRTSEEEYVVPAGPQHTDTPAAAQGTEASGSDLAQEAVALQPDFVSEELPERVALAEETTPIASDEAQEAGREVVGDVGSTFDTAAAEVDVPHPASATISPEQELHEAQPATNDVWAPISSKKGKKNKKKKKQSISLSEDVVTTSAPEVSGYKDSNDPEDVTSAPDVLKGNELLGNLPVEAQTKEAVEATLQPLEIESAANGMQGTSEVELAKDTTEPSIVAASDAAHEVIKEDSAQDSSVIAKEMTDEPSSLVFSPTDTSRGLAEEHEIQPQVAEEPSFAVAEEEFPIFSKKSKKNKKKGKGSVVQDESRRQSESNLTAEEPETVGQTIATTEEQATPAGEPSEPVTLSTHSQNMSNMWADINALDGSDAELRSTSPAKELSKAIDAPATSEYPVAGDVPSEQPASLAHATIEESSPKDEALSHDDTAGLTDAIPNEVISSRTQATHREDSLRDEPLTDSLSQGMDVRTVIPEDSSVSKPENIEKVILEPELETHGPTQIDESSEPHTEGQNAESPSEPASSYLQDSPAPTVAPVSEEPPAVAAEQSSPEFDLEEAKRREADAAQVEQEEAEVARIQLKRKPSKKDKQRLKELKARAEQRAEEAEAAAVSRDAAALEQPGTLEAQDDSTAQTSNKDEADVFTPAVQESATTELQDVTHVENQESEPVTAEKTANADSPVDASARADDPPPEDSQTQTRDLEESEDIARREAEAALIQQEENELSRLKLKRKPSKKDKERIKTLKANAEQRNQEAEIAAQTKMEEYPADTSHNFVDAAAPTDDKGISQDAAADVEQPALFEPVLDDVEASKDMPEDLTTEPPPEAPALADEEEDAQSKPAHADNSLGEDSNMPHSQEDAATQPIVHDESESRELLSGEPAVHERDIQQPGSLTNVLGETVHATKDHEEAALNTEHDVTSQEDITQPAQTSLSAVNPSSSELREDVLQSSSVVDVDPPHDIEPSSVTGTSGLEEPEDIKSGDPALESQQFAGLESQPEPEWFVPVKKSKKDKKKKRKGTISSESGQASGFATPAESSEAAIPADQEQPPATQPSEFAAETLASAEFNDSPPREAEVILPENDKSANLSEMKPAETTLPDSPREIVTEDVSSRDLDNQESAPIFKEAEDIGADQPQLSETEHAVEATAVPLPNLDSPEPAAPLAFEEDELSAGLERPASAHDAISAASITPIDPEPIVIADETTSNIETGQDADSEKHEFPEITQRANESPLEAEPTTAAVDDDKEAREEEFVWAPSKKSKKDKKKKRTSVSWAEPSDDVRTPVDANMADKENSGEVLEAKPIEDTAAPEQSLSQDEPVVPSSDAQQPDEWSSAVSKKGKKGKKKKNRSSFEPWEPENIAQTPIDDEKPAAFETAEEPLTDSTPADTTLVSEVVRSPTTRSPGLPNLVSSAQADETPALAADETPQRTSEDVAVEEASTKQEFGSISKDDQGVAATDLQEDDYLPVAQDTARVSGADQEQPFLEEVSAPSDPVIKLDVVSQDKREDDTLFDASGQHSDRGAVATTTTQGADEDPWKDGSEPLPVLERTLSTEPVTKTDALSNDADEERSQAGDGDETLVAADNARPAQSEQTTQDEAGSEGVVDPSPDFLDVDRPAMRPQSPVPWEDDERSGHRQEDSELLSVTQPSARPESPRSWEDQYAVDNFATPSEQPADIIKEKQTSATEDPVPSEDPSEATRDSNEPAEEAFDTWLPRKLSKKEKRKAKKGSLSTTEPEVNTTSEAATHPIASREVEAQRQVPLDLDDPELLEDGGRTLPEAPHLASTNVVAEPEEEQGLPQPLGSHNLPAETSGQASTSFDDMPEPEPTVEEATIVEETPILNRKLSKKEKRKAKKKATSQWEDDVFESSPAANDVPVPEDAAVAEEPETSFQNTEDKSFAPEAGDELPAEKETTTADEVVEEDDWSVPLSRKKSKKDKKRGRVSGQTSGTQTPFTGDAQEPMSAKPIEFKSRNLDTQQTVEPVAGDYSDPTSPAWATPVEHLQIPTATQPEMLAAGTERTELQKVRSAAASPDIWENEDYFKPRSPNVPAIDPPDEPFDRIEIHPAFARDVNASPDRHKKDDRPLVGLGLIHRHSSIFQEGDQHTPKLLTMASDNFSLESVAVEDTAPLGSPSYSGARPLAETASTAGSSRPRDPVLGFDKTSTTAHAVSSRDLSDPSLGGRRSISPSPSTTSHEAGHDASAFDDMKKLAKTGSVALLAERFGGTKKGSGKNAPIPRDGGEQSRATDGVPGDHDGDRNGNPSGTREDFYSKYRRWVAHEGRTPL